MNPFDDILRGLPHRYPFLFVDRVDELKAGKSIIAAKQVSAAEPYFQGHFPGRPVMPGVLMIEALAQACGLLMILSRDSEGRRPEEYMLLVGVDKCRFRRLVAPGDTLILRGVIARQLRGIVRFNVCATVGDETACEAELMMMSQLKK